MPLTVQSADGTSVRVQVSVVISTLTILTILLPTSHGQACTVQNCRPPNCFCKGGEIPAGLPLTSTPQMIMLTFDDAVNQAHFPLYESLYRNKVNPDGCPARGTFYVCHDYSNYQMVQSLYKAGHEIASHSISHRLPSNWWSFASTAEWSSEIEGQRQILSSWANIPKSEIRGMRAPYLSVGGDAQFQMINGLLADNFVYDSSVVSSIHRQSAFISPTWPYTMDYPPNDECLIPPCPSQSYPGVWEIPLVSTQTPGGRWCSMEDECTPGMSENQVYTYFLNNFERHYTSNRAPFGIFLHGPFLQNSAHFRALDRFMTDVTQRRDVFFVTAWQVIQWMKTPTPLGQLGRSFCPNRTNAPTCSSSQANFCLFDGGASLVNRKKRSSGRFERQIQGNQTAGNPNTGNQTAGIPNNGNQTTGNATFERQIFGNQATGNQTAGNQTAGNQTFAGLTFDNMVIGELYLEEQLLGNQTVGNQTFGNQVVGNQTAGNQTFGNQVIGNQTAGNFSSMVVMDNLELENQAVGNQTVGNQTTGNQTVSNLTSEDAGFAEMRIEKFDLRYLGSARNTRQASSYRRHSLRQKRQAYNGWHNMYTCKPCPQSYPWIGNSEGL